jgi:hypothetical protein
MGIELHHICKLVPAISKQVTIRIGVRTKNIDTLSPGDLPGLFVIIKKKNVKILDLNPMRNYPTEIEKISELIDFIGNMESGGAIILRLDGIIKDMIKAVPR